MDGTVRFVPKRESSFVCLFVLVAIVYVELFTETGNKISTQLVNCERFKEQLNRIDGTVVFVPEDFSYVDVKIAEANYDLVR